MAADTTVLPYHGNMAYQHMLCAMCYVLCYVLCAMCYAMCYVLCAMCYVLLPALIFLEGGPSIVVQSSQQ